MPERIYATVEPELLFWARQSARLELDEAARKAHVRPEALVSWEAGQSRPTIPQLRELARVYKRPLVVFYLPEPPVDFQPLRDFRRLQGASSEAVSPELAFEMRWVQTRRQIAIDLHETIGQPPEVDLSATVRDDPEALGARMRLFLGLSLDRGYDFRGWRGAFEQKGILVFQIRHVEVQEARGFSISETPLPTVVVNNKDAESGRVFTMLHELGHLALRAGGICDLLEHSGVSYEERRTEVFCNAAAAAALLPKDVLLNDRFVQSHRGAAWSDQELRSIGNRYSVSRESVLRRLLTFGKTTESFYQETRERYAQERESSTFGARRGGPTPPHRTALSTLGHTFTRIVLENYYSTAITAADVAEYLNIKLKHLPKIESEVTGVMPA